MDLGYDNFIFIESPEGFCSPSAFTAHLTNISGKQALFAELYTKLEFPKYFGFNWDALYDLLCDFNWIEQREIVLVHDQVPDLDQNSMKTYLEILHDSIHSWKDDEDHSFEVIFSINDRKLLESVYQ